MLMDMFKTFFKIGAFTFGGGFAMIPIIQKEIVDNKKWIGEEDFLDTISVAQSAPGPIAINSSIYVGYRIKGLKGALICTLGSVLPSFLIILVVARFFYGFGENKLVESIFSGIRPAVVGLIFSALYRLIYKSNFTYLSLFVSLIALLAVGFFNISPIYLVAVGVSVSVAVNRFRRN